MNHTSNKEEVLREALDCVYEMGISHGSESILEAIRSAHKTLSELFANEAPPKQREEVLQGALDFIYHEAVAEEYDGVAEVVRGVYRSTARLWEKQQVA